MLKRMKRNKGQNTAEYAILIALVVGAVIAMQTYAQRGLQARMRGTSLYMTAAMGNALKDAGYQGQGVGTLNATNQYVPYYEDTAQKTTKQGIDDTYADQNSNSIGKSEISNRTKAAPADINNPAYGYERTIYNSDIGRRTQD